MDNNLKISNIPKDERPREKLIKFGPESLSNKELLAVILRCGTRGENILSLSDRILSEVSGLDGLLNISFDDAMKIKGIKEGKASQILALSELFKRFNTLRANSIISISKPQDVADMLINEMKSLNQEVLKLLVLNTKNKIIKIKDVFKGTLNSSIVHPREVFKEAVSMGSASIIVCHNHPSGDPSPSKEDINITKNSDCLTGLRVK